MSESKIALEKEMLTEGGLAVRLLAEVRAKPGSCVPSPMSPEKESGQDGELKLVSIWGSDICSFGLDVNTSVIFSSSRLDFCCGTGGIGLRMDS